MLESYGRGPGHVFNLGHGIQPGVDPERVAAMVAPVQSCRPHTIGDGRLTTGRGQRVGSNAIGAAFAALLAMSGCGRAPEAPADAPPVPDLSDHDIARLQRAMRDGTLDSRRITQWALNRIAALDDAGPMLNAVVATNPDALAIADALDAERRAGKLRGPLHGIPVLLKDNIDTGDRQLTTTGSRALRPHRHPPMRSWCGVFARPGR